MKAPLAQQQALAGQTPYWVGPQQREKLRQQNEIAKLLQQATLDTQQAQAKGVQLANLGRQLANQNARRQMQRDQSGYIDPVKKAQIANYQSQIKAREAKPKTLTPAQERLAPHLPPTVDPFSATTRDWVQAGEAMRAGVVSKPTAAQTQTDKKFADDYLAWKARGGMSDVQKNLSQLDEAIATLNSGRNVTGGAYSVIPDKALAMWNPEAVDTKEKVSEVVQRNLRLILGAQFTEKEGQQLISRAYNDGLDETVNAARVGRLRDQIAAAAEARNSASEYYEANGTLTGWTGPSYEEMAESVKTANEWDGQGKIEPGMSYKGHIYKGGPANDPSSWVKE